MPYAVEVTGKVACGCVARVDFDLPDDAEPTPGDVGAILYASLDPEISNMLEFLMDHRHADAGYEKITVTAQVKVR
jgi:hypothetical protein